MVARRRDRALRRTRGCLAPDGSVHPIQHHPTYFANVDQALIEAIGFLGCVGPLDKGKVGRVLERIGTALKKDEFIYQLVSQLPCAPAFTLQDRCERVIYSAGSSPRRASSSKSRGGAVSCRTLRPPVPSNCIAVTANSSASGT